MILQFGAMQLKLTLNLSMEVHCLCFSYIEHIVIAEDHPYNLVCIFLIYHQFISSPLINYLMKKQTEQEWGKRKCTVDPNQ